MEKSNFYNDNIITLNDENGEELKYEFLDSVKFNKEEYFVLLSTEEKRKKDRRVVIIKIEKSDENGEEFYSIVKDDNTFSKVYNIFYEKLNDYYENKNKIYIIINKIMYLIVLIAFPIGAFIYENLPISTEYLFNMEYVVSALICSLIFLIMSGKYLFPIWRKKAKINTEEEITEIKIWKKIGIFLINCIKVISFSIMFFIIYAILYVPLFFMVYVIFYLFIANESLSLTLAVGIMAIVLIMLAKKIVNTLLNSKKIHLKSIIITTIALILTIIIIIGIDYLKKFLWLVLVAFLLTCLSDIPTTYNTYNNFNIYYYENKNRKS